MKPQFKTRNRIPTVTLDTSGNPLNMRIHGARRPAHKTTTWIMAIWVLESAETYHNVQPLHHYDSTQIGAHLQTISMKEQETLSVLHSTYLLYTTHITC